MLISIRHCVRYRYDSPVFLEPHTVRLFPRLGASVRLVASDLQVDPLPWVRADNLDKEGNTVFQTWFEGPTSHLTVDSRVTVETLVTDPFRFLATDPAWPLRMFIRPGGDRRWLPIAGRQTRSLTPCASWPWPPPTTPVATS